MDMMCLSLKSYDALTRHIADLSSQQQAQIIMVRYRWLDP